MSDDSKQKNELLTFEETIGVDLKSYIAEDSKGNEVLVNTKNTEKHASGDPLEQHPTVFHNLGRILVDPQTKEEDSKSQAPAALERLKRGALKILTKRGFIDELKMPGDPCGDVELVVFYDNDDNADPKNYTLTYRVIK